MAAHLSLGLKNNLRIGVTNQTPDFPLMTVSFFLSNKNKYFSIEPSNLYQNKEEYNKNLYSRNCIRISPFKKPNAINLNGKRGSNNNF